ncbi:hypothetical protein EGW08_023518 [Elysia chlorotica]|uniref:Uncharacterized protein n=1 Tax=Elysia chlorotica TaxID=188477 RepID=A0A433SIF9_ELYCH|nr:hypothetical protein EGW08_023518 [Elysia chlorotica]
MNASIFSDVSNSYLRVFNVNTCTLLHYKCHHILYLHTHTYIYIIMFFLHTYTYIYIILVLIAIEKFSPITRISSNDLRKIYYISVYTNFSQCQCCYCITQRKLCSVVEIFSLTFF